MNVTNDISEITNEMYSNIFWFHIDIFDWLRWIKISNKIVNFENFIAIFGILKNIFYNSE